MSAFFGDPPRPEVPFAVRKIVGETLAEAFTQRELISSFVEADAPGEPPLESNKAAMCSAWLKRCGHVDGLDPFTVLGKVLAPLMDDEGVRMSADGLEKSRDRVRTILRKNGLSYQAGGRIFGGGSVSAPSRSLAEIIRSRDLKTTSEEFDRALSAVEQNPRDALTAACTILESLFKIYIEDEHLTMPSDQSVKPLWSTVQKHLRLDPSAIPDPDARPILGGLSAIVDGIGSWRTHKGSAHGAGRTAYRPEPRHARLAVHAAHTLATFVLETWDVRRSAPR
jgi:hypothetical protein